jgi:hypothetical protein
MVTIHDNMSDFLWVARALHHSAVKPPAQRTMTTARVFQNKRETKKSNI